jgi:hypothetical protein
MKRLRHISLLLALAIMPLFLSCEFATTETNDVAIWLICSGGTTSNIFSFDLILDNKTPLSNIAGVGTRIIPAGNIEKATISVTKADPTASLTIAVYNNNEFDENGYATLDSCTTTSTSCSNTLSLQYEVKSKDDTEGTAAATTTGTTSTTE